MSVVASFESQRRRRTIPELLLARQQFGMTPSASTSSNLGLASRIAWNPSRMRNMILCVGPGTPASVCMVKPSSSASSNDRSASESGEGEEEEEEEEQEDEVNQAITEFNLRRLGDVHHPRQADVMDEDDGDDDDDDDSEGNFAGNSDDSDAQSDEWTRRRYDDQETLEGRFAGRSLMEWMDSDGGDSEDDEDDLLDTIASSASFVPSIRHGGCINTAAWLTSPWRLSLCGRGDSDVTAIPSDECPTQLITSGDDRLIKFWDVRHSIGTSNTLGGGKNTVCPLSSDVPMEAPIDEWKEYQAKSSLPLSGSVLPLATLQTRHRGNVFHVTPLDHQPGKVVTCAADGYLRCSDLSSGTSSVVLSPEFDRQEYMASVSGLMSLRPGMCFSHHFLDANTGLLCSERGLRKFDLRLHPREQDMKSVLSSKTCKACAIWSADSTDSAYIFAGGTSANVALYDLRMISDADSPSKVVQLYRPRGLEEYAPVSVSGIDISKNKKELLVSYENDQIYSFPICPHSASPSGPTVDELTELSRSTDEEESIQCELCAYGGHLNRYTFLKNAKYAGPNDEYICTGSDSGHAWIYEKSTGSVVSFLSADNSTCNGIVPHPTLPLFVSYGIDSTAKLWRATVPVDRDVDDSPQGRLQYFRRRMSYEKSPLVRSWSYCKGKLSEFKEIEDSNGDNFGLYVLPDDIPSTGEILNREFFGVLSSIFDRNRQQGNYGRGRPFTGNDFKNLPQVLRQNLFACILAQEGAEDEPIRSDIKQLRSRMSMMRLHHQALQKGLLFNPQIPWQLRRSNLIRTNQLKNGDKEQVDAIATTFDPADLIPESPSEWIPFDPEMTKKPMECGLQFNLEDYKEFYEKHYASFGFSDINEGSTEGAPDSPATPVRPPQRNKRKLENHGDKFTQSDIATTGDVPSDDTLTPSLLSPDEGEGLCKVSRARKILQDTVLILKNSGNDALKQGLSDLAARRYDQGIQYCAIAFLEFPYGAYQLFAARGTATDPRHEWSPLLKLLVTTRLNLSMVMLKLPEPEPRRAAELALLALNEIAPFVSEKGKIVIRRGKNKFEYKDEPESTFIESKHLQAKAYFRLGSAQHELGEFSSAVKSFEGSMICTTEVGVCEPDSAVSRRLMDARRALARRRKNQRKKLKAAFDREEEQNESSELGGGHKFQFNVQNREGSG